MYPIAVAAADGLTGIELMVEAGPVSFRQPKVASGMTLPFVPMTMTFTDVHYFVNCPPVRFSAAVCIMDLPARVSWIRSPDTALLLCKRSRPCQASGMGILRPGLTSSAAQAHAHAQAQIQYLGAGDGWQGPSAGGPEGRQGDAGAAARHLGRFQARHPHLPHGACSAMTQILLLFSDGSTISWQCWQACATIMNLRRSSTVCGVLLAAASV